MTELYFELWDLLRFRWVFYVLRILWVMANNLYCIPVHLLMLILAMPLQALSPALYNTCEETLYTWLLAMVSCWVWSNGYQLAESGDSLDSHLEENLLLMPNHQSTADVPFMMTIFTARSRFTGRAMWIMDRVFKFTNFGIISWLHEDFFIRAGKATRDSSLEDLRHHLQRSFAQKQRKYLVLFPEGGFLRKRKAISQSFAKKKDLPILEHCTIPRTGALDIIMSVLGPTGTSPPDSRITKVVDVTIAYPEGRPLDLQTIIGGWRPPCTTHVHYRIFDSKDLPTDPEAVFDWMVRLYQEKESLLEEFYRTGAFPHARYSSNGRPPTLLKHSPAYYLALHTFFLVANLAVLWTYSCLYAAIFPS